jgi:hypothetical protein
VLITLAQNNEIRGLDLGNSSTAIFSNASFGALSVGSTSINTNGTAIDVVSGSFNTGAAFSSITSTGGTYNIALTSVGGAVDFGTGSLAGATSTSFAVHGGTVSTTYSGSISQSNAGAKVVNFTGNHTSGTITFQTGTLSATNGDGIAFSNADGTYNFNGTTTLNGGAARIGITGGSDGTFNFSANTNLTVDSGTAFTIDASNANVTYSGNISKGGGYAVDINNHDGGTVTFQTGTIAQTTGGAFVRVQNSNGGAINFNGSTTLTTTSDTAVQLLNNTGSTVSFGGILNINTASGTGFIATGGGTLTVQGTGNSITTATGRIIDWDGVSIGASGVTFTSLSSTGTVAADAISLNNVDGAGTFSGGSVTIADTSGANSDGIAITGGSAAAFTFASATIDNTSGAGVNLNGANGSVTFTTVDIDGTSGAAVSVTSNTNAISINGGMIGASVDTGSGTRAVDISGGNGNVTVAASITNTASEAIYVTNRSGGAVAFSGSLNHAASAVGFGVYSNTAGSTTFSGSSKAANSGNFNAVDLVSNTGHTIDFSGGGLDLDTTGGRGFNATDGGTVTVQGLGNSITSTATGTALNIANTTIGASDVTFQSISAGTGSGSAGVGISLNTTGSLGGLHITGDGTAGSGGTIQHKTGADGSTTSGIGIYLNNTSDVQLAWMQLNDFDNFAIRGSNVTGFALDRTVISGSNGTLTTFSVGEGSISFTNLLGTASITNSNISGGVTNNIEIINSSGTLNRLTIDGSTIGANGLTTGHAGLYFSSTLTAVMNLTVSNSAFTSARNINMEARSDDSSNMDVVVTSSQFSNNHANRTSAGSISLSSSDSSQMTYAVTGGNTFRDAISTALTVVGTGTAQVRGSITGNTFGVSGVAGSGSSAGSAILLEALSSAVVTGDVRDNLIRQYGQYGIFLLTINLGDSPYTHVLNATITGNAISEPYTGGTSTIQYGVFSSASGSGTINVLLGDATSAALQNTLVGSGGPGDADVRIERNSGTVNVSRGGSTAGTVAEVVQDNNVGDPTVTTAGTINLVSGAPPLPLLALPGGVAAADLEPNVFEAVETGAAPTAFPQATEDRSNDTETATQGVPDDPVPDAAPEPSVPDVSAEATVPEVVTAVTETVLPVPSSSVPVSPILDDGLLSQAELDYLIEAAIQRWISAGLSAEQLAFIESVSFEIGHMSGWHLGSASAGHIIIDSDAAGFGWYIDSTPLDDAEFPHGDAATRFYTDPTSAPAGRYDLLTTVMHELGHQLGLPDYYSLVQRNNLMYGYLTFGERRLPAAGQADGFAPGTVMEESFLGSPVTIDTLPAGKSVQIIWQATINAQTNKVISNPTNSGTVSATNAVGFPDASTNTVITTLDTLTLGGTVWNDNGAGGGVRGNGIQDGTEPGVDGVFLILFVDANNDDALDHSIASATTAGGGNYSFAGLAPGNYIVRVEQDNFDAGGNTSLFDLNLQISPVTSPEPADPDAGDPDVDNDDNGYRTLGQPAFSKAITLAYNTEPTTGAGNDTNNTLDFGFLANTPPSADNVGPFSGTEDQAERIEITLNGSDPDAGDAVDGFILETLAANGQLFAAAAGGGALTVGAVIPATGTGPYTATVYFQPNADWNGSTSFNYSAFDDVESGTAATASISISAVADIVNDTATTNEDTPVNVLVLANETFESVPAITGTTNGTNGSVAVNNNGTPADTTDDFVVYTPNADFNGSDSFTYTVSSGGVTEIATVNVTINAVVDIASDSATTDEDMPVNVLVLANDTFEGTWAITGTTNGTNGSVTTNNNGTPGNPADDFVVYTPSTDFNGSDSFTYTVTSGGVTESATVDVTITPVNDAPVLAGLNATPTYVEQAAPVVLDSTLTLSDVDAPAAGNQIGSATITITGGLFTGDVLGANTSGTAISANYLNGVLTLSGADTLANYEAVLKTITFASSSENPTNGGANPSRTIQYMVTDLGTAGSAPQQLTLTITATNDAPVNTVPGERTATMNTNLVITGLSVSDVDAAGGTLTTVLAVDNGTLTVASAGGAAVAGSGTDTVTLTGTVTQINTTLSAAGNVIYRGDLDFAGNDTLTMTTNDGGHTGAALQQDQDTVAIIIDVGDRALSYRQDKFIVNLQAGSQINIAGNMAYYLDRDLGLFFGGSYFQDYAHMNEIWLMGASNQFGNPWYFVKPDGQLFEWDGTGAALGSALVFALDPLYYHYPTLLFDATAGTMDYVLDQALALDFAGTYAQNYGGRDEKWLLGQGNQWFFIDSVGRFHIWDGTLNRASGPRLTTLDAMFWAQPERLYNAQANEVTAAIVSNVLSIDPIPNWTGQIVVERIDPAPFVHNEKFTLEWVSHAPVLTPVGNRTMPTTQDTLTISLAATDDDLDPLTFSALGGHRGYVLDQALGLRFELSLYENYGGQGEKWLQSTAEGWHFIKPDGALFRWDRTANQATGTLVANLDPIYHLYPSLLYDAPPGDLARAIDQTLGLTFTGNLYLNYGGQNEKWLQAADGQWYFIKPNGEFWQWDQTSNQATGKLLATLDPDHWSHVERLYDAHPDPVVVSLAGNQLTLNPVAGFIGEFWVVVKVSDNSSLVYDLFKLSVT